MPTIGYLHGLGCRSRCSLAVSATAVARDDADFRLTRQPVLDGGGLAVGEQVDDAAPLEVADDAPVALSAFPRPIVDADDAQGRAIAGGVPAHDPQQGVFADRQHQPPRERGRRSTTQGYAEMMHDCLEPRGAPRRSFSHRVAELLGKNAALATGFGTAKSANRDAHLNGATMRGQVQEPPLIAAVHLLGLPPAIGTCARGGATPGDDADAIGSDLDIIDQQTGRRQRPKTRIHHGKHPPTQCLPNLAYLHRK